MKCVLEVFAFLSCTSFSFLPQIKTSSAGHHHHQQWQTLYHKISQDSEFSSFNSLIQTNRIAKMHLHYYDLTLFVPTNQAIDRYDGRFNDMFLFYHFASTVRDFLQLNKTQILESANEENPPIWVTATPRGVYVNNAKVIQNKTVSFSNQVRMDNLRVKRSERERERVLDPVMLHQWPRPNALDFLAHSSNWAISKSSTRHFFNKIVYHQLTSLFEKNGGHTFFVPVDQKLDAFRLEHIDKYIVRAHVIQNQVLFTRPCEKQFIYETEANGDYIYVVLSLEQSQNKYFVRSHTVLGDSNHKKGDLLVEIVKSDIPVRNGVVHLIQRPLGVFDRELKPFPYLSVFYKLAADPQLNITFNLGNANGLNELLRKSGGKGKKFTYFAPRDQAWRRVQRDENILKSHLIADTTSFTMRNLMEMQAQAHAQANSNLVSLVTLGGVVELRFAIKDGVYFVEWKGREIRIVRGDYECSDGVVHVIDGVFSREIDGDAGGGEVGGSGGEWGFWKMLKMTFT